MMETHEPVAVRVVLPLPTTEVSTRAGGMGNLTVGPDPVHVVGQNPYRKRLILSASGGDVYLGTTAGIVASKSGFHLASGQLMEITHFYELWAIADTTDVELSYMEEECR